MQDRMRTVHSVAPISLVQKCSLYLIPFFSLILCMIIQNSSTYRLPKVGMCLFLNAILQGYKVYKSIKRIQLTNPREVFRY